MSGDLWRPQNFWSDCYRSQRGGDGLLRVSTKGAGPVNSLLTVVRSHQWVSRNSRGERLCQPLVLMMTRMLCNAYNAKRFEDRHAQRFRRDSRNDAPDAIMLCRWPSRMSNLRNHCNLYEP